MDDDKDKVGSMKTLDEKRDILSPKLTYPIPEANLKKDSFRANDKVRGNLCLPMAASLCLTVLYCTKDTVGSCSLSRCDNTNYILLTGSPQPSEGEMASAVGANR